MLGKMSKYFLILGMLGLFIQTMIGPPKGDTRLLTCSLFCIMFFWISFIGWILNRPFVVHIDNPDR